MFVAVGEPVHEAVNALAKPANAKRIANAAPAARNIVFLRTIEVANY
jgi:hypothetical protein